MAASRPARRVWDPLVRVVHWALAASIALAWFTRSGGGKWHEWIGYASLVLVVVRLAWGWRGSHYARFSQFVRSPGFTLRYGVQVLKGAAPRYLGHNPLGGWMILALLSDTALVGLSGWLYTTDAFWGVAWVERTHDVLAISLLALIALHVTGVIVTSLSHRENLAASMLHGRKRAPDAEDAS
jgi:cytochrome b